jgi:hypothetical protein
MEPRAQKDIAAGEGGRTRGTRPLAGMLPAGKETATGRRAAAAPVVVLEVEAGGEESRCGEGCRRVGRVGHLYGRRASSAGTTSMAGVRPPRGPPPWDPLEEGGGTEGGREGGRGAATSWPSQGRKPQGAPPARTGTGGGPKTGTRGRVDMGWVRKKSLFGRNAPQIASSMVVPPFWSSCNLTGGFGVRGKADPNWVRKVFNCLRSLYRCMSCSNT